MPDSATDLFWLLWGATCVLVVYVILHEYFTGRMIFGMPLLAALMFGYFYVFQAYFVATSLADKVLPWMLELGQAIALGCFAALILGWRFGLREVTNFQPVKISRIDVNYNRLWRIGVVVTLIAIVCLHSSDFRNIDYDWKGVSAYWYMLFHIGYPGLLACTFVIVRDHRYQTIFHKFFLLSLGVALTYIFFLSARRGPIFPLVVFIVYGLGIISMGKPKKKLLLLSLAAIGLLMLAFPHVRNYADGSMSAWNLETVEDVSLDTITVGKAKESGDNEYLYHTATIATAYEFDAYQYGTGYLTLMTHWIPRIMWPSKPELGEGFYIAAPSLVYSLVGWELSSGASAGGVADTFVQLGFFAFLLWFIFGYIFARLFSSHYSSKDLLGPALYVALMATMHWLISQGVTAAFVPIMIYVVVTIVIFKLSKHRV